MDIKEKVQYLAKKYDTHSPYELADYLGICVYRIPLGSIRGYFYGERRIKQIFLNNELSDHTERFVLAHEIGHSVMHPKSNTLFLQNTLFSTDRLEIQANKFAIELLLPDRTLMEHPDYTMQNWASLYGLPLEIIELKKG